MSPARRSNSSLTGPGFVLSRVVAVAFQSQFDRGAIELPPLRARELKHENVMGIEMGVEALRPRRGQIDVRLEWAKFEL